MDETTVLAVLTEIRDELRLLRMTIYARDEFGFLTDTAKTARAAGRDLHNGAQMLTDARAAADAYAEQLKPGSSIGDHKVYE